MALLERIKEMKNQGFDDNNIITSLREEGISSKEINNAFSQLNIKSAVSANSEMTPSIMPSTPEQEMTPAPEVSYSQEQYANQTAYQQQAYPEQQYAYTAPAQENYYAQALDIETVRDVCKQEIDEALKKIKPEIENLPKLKSEMKFEMQDIENRLARIESVMQDLQSAIIRKMGEYGESISGISKEIRATQESFSKILNPLFDKRKIISEDEREQNKKSGQQPVQKSQQEQKRAPQESSGNSASFEDYFR